jgi:aerobic carbon-monoxide dehydrogenase medium subunit
VQLHQPETIDDAIQLLAESDGEAKIIAGGTAVVLMMQQQLIAPEALVSTFKIPGLQGITDDNGSIQIGANTLLRDVAASPIVRAYCPSLVTACAQVGNVRIRNAATLGGNLAEADYASDPPAVLVALNATIEIEGPTGTRSSTVADLIEGFYSTSLDLDEVITCISLPKNDPASSAETYIKFKSRSSEDRPCVGVAAWGSSSEHAQDQFSALSVVIGAATATPQRFENIEREAIGVPVTDQLINELADGFADAIDPIEDLRGSAWYRQQMVRTFVSEALRDIRSKLIRN